MTNEHVPLAVAVPARFVDGSEEHTYGGTRFWIAAGRSGSVWAIEVDDPCAFGYAATKDEAIAKAKRFIDGEGK